MNLNWTVPFTAREKHSETWSSRVVSAVHHLWQARRRRRAEHIAIEQLSAMSDRELQDIGLIRSEIGVAVHIEPLAASRFGSNEPRRFKWRSVNPGIR